MKYAANFKKGNKGNFISEGDILSINIDGAYFFSGGIYKDGFPVLAFQTKPGDKKLDLRIKRDGLSLKGNATLKIKAFDKEWKGEGWSDDFIIT